MRVGHSKWTRPVCAVVTCASASSAGCDVILGINKYADGNPPGAGGSASANSGGAPSGTAGTAGSAGSGGQGGDAACVPNDTKPCYDGPPGTEGVGLCKAGTMVCNAAGTGFGPCLGAVKPQPENCNTAADEACNNDAVADCGALVGSPLSTGGIGVQGGAAVALDPSGAPTVVGTYAGEMSLLCKTFPVPINTDAFALKLSSDLGICGWGVSLGDGGTQTAQAVAILGGSDVVVAGSITGDLPNCPMGGLVGRSYLARLVGAGGGACVWGLPLGDSAAGIGVDVVQDGNIVVANHFSGSFSLPGCTTVMSKGSSDILVAKLEPSKNCVWLSTFGSSAFDGALDVAGSAGNGVFVTGRFQGNLGGINCGSVENMTNSDGNDDMFLMKLSSDGACVWAKGFGSTPSSTSIGEHLAIMPDGTVLLQGRFTGDIDLGGGATSAPSGGETFVAAFDDNGSYKWSRLFKNAGATMDIAVDKAALNVVLAGRFEGTLHAGSTVLTSAGLDDVLVAKLDADGDLVWAKRFGDAQGQAATGAAINGAGEIFLTGHFAGEIDFGGKTLSSSGDSDVFVVKLSP